MLTKRIIPCLDVKKGSVVKGKNFTGLEYVGDPVKLAKKYNDEGADELVFLDITASYENRKTMKRLVERLSKQLSKLEQEYLGLQSGDELRPPDRSFS